MNDIQWPAIAVTKPHDVECDACHEQNASVLIAASNQKKLRLCEACARDVTHQLEKSLRPWVIG